MHQSCRWIGLRAFALSLGIVASTAACGQASTLVNYSTSGTIDSTGVTGAGVIGFNSIGTTSNTFDAPSQFSLGTFQVAPLNIGQTTTYDNTPFHITFLVNSINGAAPSPNQTPIVVSGTLSGTVTGADQTDVVATFNPVSHPTFQTGNLSDTLTIPNSPLSLVPSSTNNGLTSAQAHFDTRLTNNTPEPTSIALFLTTLAGLGVRQRLRGRRAA